MRRLRSISLIAAAGALLCAPFLAAQSAPRIAGPIDESSLVTLKGNVPSSARPQFDQGEAAPSTELHFVRLVLARSPEQEAALESFLAQQIDKSSPNYHHWLTPQEFGRLYGPADSDIAAITAWLESHGLHVETISPGRVTIPFSGTVTQIQEAFHTSIHSYARNGRQFLSNNADPSIPAALAPVIAGVSHLNTIQPRPFNVRGDMGQYDADQKRLVPVSPYGMLARPELTVGTSPNFALYVTAADAATIYDTPNSFNGNFTSGTSYNGHGVTIGIGGDALILASTVVKYRTRFLNGDTTAPTINNYQGKAVAGGDTDEAYIDTELAGGMAPGAAIVFYTADDAVGGVGQAIDNALTANTVDIFSLSFGACEKSLGNASNQEINALWQQAAGQGITVTVSTGDSGSAGCDNDNTEQLAVDGLQVSGFATTPYNIAVGGTDYYGLLNGFTTYVGTTGSGVGSAANFYRSAKSYIPESTWNDSTPVNGALANNTTYINTSNNQSDIVGGSGGVSACSTSTTNSQTGITTCTSGYAKPSWQRGAGVPADSARDIPDVSLMGGNGFYGAAWLVCTDDTGTVGTINVTADCSTQSNNQFYFQGFGGTSTSAPAMAGILAIVEQKVGSRLGTEVPKNFYDLYNGSHASAVFHDITQGNNSVPCVATPTVSPNCVKNTAGDYFLSGYDTTTGYDRATGIGSVDATALLTYWSNASGSTAPTITVAPSSSTITTNEAVSVVVTITGTVGTPTGTVTLSGGGYTSASETLVAGAYTFSISAGKLAAGSDTLTVSYSGDTNYSAATKTATVTVDGATVTVTPAASSIVVNQSLGVTVTVTTATGEPAATGTVTLSGGGYSGTATNLVSGSATITIPASTLNVGSDTLTATYSGNTHYATSTGTASVTITAIAKTTPTVTVIPASATPYSSESLSVQVKVTATAGTPTGTVTLSGGGYSGTATNLTAGDATITIPANTLTDSADTLTATYSGDSSFNTATGTASVTPKTPVTLSSSTPTAVSPGGSATATITLTQADTNYAGTITLACALATSPSGASDLPTCTAAQPAAFSGGTATATVTISTTAPSAVKGGGIARNVSGWAGAGGGAVLAFVLFLGIPARRRSWRNLVGLLVLMAALGSLSACGGGGSTGNKNPGTTAGAYTFTVTATGSPAISPSPTATVNLTVN